MNDFDYDALQKKRIARGARYRVKGGNRKTRFLTTDDLTTAQLRRLNGPVKTYKMGAPMAWSDFKQMPKDLQRKYLEDLMDTYGATDGMLAKMFGLSGSMVARTRRALSIPTDAKRKSHEDHCVRDLKWEAFCNGVVGGGDYVAPKESMPEEPVIPAGVKDNEPVLEEEHLPMSANKAYLELSGPLNIADLAKRLSVLGFEEGELVSIRVEIKSV